MINLEETNKKMLEMGRAWAEYKSTNDERLGALEKRNPVDPLLLEQLSRLNEVIERNSEYLSKQTVDSRRPGLSEEQRNPSEKRLADYLTKGIIAGDKGTHVPYAVGDEEHGGMLVDPHISKHMVSEITHRNPLRQLSTVENVSSSTLEIIDDSALMGFGAMGWATERSLPGGIADTHATRIRKITVPVHEMYVQPLTTSKFEEDNRHGEGGIVRWFVNKATSVFARQEETAMISGSGVDKPLGILKGGIAAPGVEPNAGELRCVSTGVDAGIVPDSLLDLLHSLPAENVYKAAFLMHRSILAQTRMLKHDGHYIWFPPSMMDGRETLLGFPVHCASSMPVMGSGNYIMLFGDFGRATVIANRRGIRVVRDVYTYKPLHAYFITFRVGFAVTDSRALVVLQS